MGADERGERALRIAERFGIDTGLIKTIPDKPTGTAHVDLNDGQPAFTVDRPVAYDFLFLTTADLQIVRSFNPDWIYFGTLHQVDASSRQVTAYLLECLPNIRRFYDVNLRANCYTSALVQALMEQADIVKLSDSEVKAVQDMFDTSFDSLLTFCSAYSKRFGWLAVCVSMGARGCAIYKDGLYEELPSYFVQVADAVGAGDAFAAALLHGVTSGWSGSSIGDFANRLGAVVASQPGATPDWSMYDKTLKRTSVTGESLN